MKTRAKTPMPPKKKYGRLDLPIEWFVFLFKEEIINGL